MFSIRSRHRRLPFFAANRNVGRRCCPCFLGLRRENLIALASGSILLFGTLSLTRPASRTDSPSASPSPIRSVRVLIAPDTREIRIRADGPLRIEDVEGVLLGSATIEDWTAVSASANGGIVLGVARWPERVIVVRPESTGVVTVSVERKGEWSPGRPYPGALRIVSDETGKLDVINYVDVEQYVACVVANEVWPTFETEAYRAQAVAARTFVLFQMLRRNDASYDVVATQSSQVYRGVRTDTPGRRATEAAEHTSGLVLTWRDGGEDRLFCAYYSAACGGVSQSAVIFGPEDDIEPLSGGVRCDYCNIAPKGTYRWGPVRMSEQEVRRRLVSSYPGLRSLGRIRDVAIIERSQSNRPVRLRLTGSSGETHDMLAERFRLALGGTKIRSTDFSIRMTSREIIFENGRGFGHGLGLCQWGAQGQALLGKRAGEILRYYYPGSRLTRAY